MSDFPSITITWNISITEEIEGWKECERRSQKSRNVTLITMDGVTQIHPTFHSSRITYRESYLGLCLMSYSQS